MVETEEDDYKLNSNGKIENLRLCLIDNKDIGIIITDKATEERNSGLISLAQLKSFSQAFSSVNNIVEALALLKNSVESNNIALSEDPNQNSIEINFSIEGYPPFDIALPSENATPQKEDNEVLPSQFDYQGNKEVEEKYRNETENTTKYVDPIIQSNVKPPIVQLEYVEPILQVHYPDGSTQSHALPPRLQGENGAPPNISSLTEEQFKSIKEQLNLDNSYSYESLTKKYVSNSAEKKNLITYSSQTSIPKFNNFSRNVVHPASREGKEPFNQTFSGNSGIKTSPKTFVKKNDYNTITNKPVSNFQIYNNFSKTNNSFYNSNKIEIRPRMTNQNPSTNRNNRALSSGGNYLRKFNSNQQSFQTINNNYSTQRQNFERIGINNVQKPLISNYNQNNIQTISNINKVNNKGNQDNLEKIKRQQEKIDEVKRQLAQIKLQQTQLLEKKKLLMQKRLMNQKPSGNNLGQNFAQVKILNTPNPKQSNARFTSNFQKLQSQNINHLNSTTKINNNNNLMTSNQIKNVKTQMINKNPPFRSQNSAPISFDTSPLTSISKDQMALAQMASIQNYTNPYYQNLQPITLEAQNRVVNYQEYEQQEKQIQNENVQEVRGYGEMGGNETPKEQESYEQNQTPQEQDNSDQNIEALFMTEQGKIIFRNGLLRGIIHKYSEIDEVVSKIQDILVKGVKFTLVYKAFDDGDRASIFHQKCDKLNMSLVLIETDKDVRFGGFTTKSWEGQCTKKFDNNAFVFSLDNNKIYDIIENEPAVGCYPKYGPVFFGCQIRIYDEFFTKGGTTCHSGLNYRTKNDFELNNGEQKYLIKDIEVYGIEAIDV